MENNLIPITAASIGGDKQQGVNARDLHAFLEVKTAFKDWIARRIEDFDFKEDSDFCSFLSESSGGRPSKEYVLTLNMAKELSMVERNEKGKQARQYFIQCEKQLKVAQQQFAIPQTYAEALRLAADKEEENQRLKVKIEEDEPKVEFADGVIATGKCLCLREAIKTCGAKPKKGFDWLRLNGFIYKQSNQATQKSIDMGLMVVRFANIPHVEGVEQKPYAHVTGKGLVYFRKKFVEAGLVLSNPNLEMRI